MIDVVIIGGGQAGLMAARELKKENIKFLVIDTKKEVGAPLRCGEGIRKKDFTELFGTTKYDFIENEVEEAKLVYTKEKRIKEGYLQINKPEFEKWLAEPVKENIQTETTCTNIQIRRNLAECKTTKGSINSSMVIIATGPNYNLHKSLGILKKEPEVAICHGGVYKINKLEQKKFYFFYEKDKKGYLWYFPKGKGRANIGYAGFEKNPKKVFNELMERHGFSQTRRENEFGGVFPVTGPIKKTYTNRIIITGTAAGFVYASTGEGNKYALKSGMVAGKIASEAVKTKKFSENFLKKYEREWKRELGKNLKTGKAIYTIERTGIELGLLDRIFDEASEEEIEQWIRGECTRKIKIAYRTIRLLNLNSREINKESFRVKLLINLYKALKRIKNI